MFAMVRTAVAFFVLSVTEVAVMVTVLPEGMEAGAEKSVVTPLAVLEAVKDPQALALPQVTVQATPAFCGSFVTKAVSPLPPDGGSVAGRGPKLTAIGGGAVLVRLKLAAVATPATVAATE